MAQTDPQATVPLEEMITFKLLSDETKSAILMKDKAFQEKLKERFIPVEQDLKAKMNQYQEKITNIKNDFQHEVKQKVQQLEATLHSKEMSEQEEILTKAVQ